jgi:polar amino acid transport system permease protein
MSNEFLSYAVHLLSRGLLTTVIVTVLGICVCVAIAFIAGTGRLSDHAVLRWISVGFIELFRGTSMVVQLFFFFYVLPHFGIPLPKMLCGILVVGFNEGAYAAEIVRAAVVGRARGQNEACIALNMGKTLRMRRVLIPQSVSTMLPPFGNVFVDLLKNSALVSIITVAGLTFQADLVRNQYGETLKLFVAILIVYFILAQIIGLIIKWLERRFALERPSRSFLRAAKNGEQPVLAGVGAPGVHDSGPDGGDPGAEAGRQ